MSSITPGILGLLAEDQRTDLEKALDKIMPFIPEHWRPIVAATIAVLAAIGVVLLAVKPAAAALLSAFRFAWHTLKRSSTTRAFQRRQSFAQEMHVRLVNLNNAESWNDQLFTDLQAEVELERESRSSLTSVLGVEKRRLRSLTRALRYSRNSRIILQGEPGAGKSVALRHVALHEALSAARARDPKRPIPLYINLREFKASPSKVNAGSVREFAKNHLNPGDDLLIKEFLDENFDEGIADGAWTFYFDSFDEIPAILSSTEADEVVNSFGQALQQFGNELNKCRILVASRSFRGPSHVNWHRFTLLPLRLRQQQDLMGRLGLDEIQQQQVLELGAGAPDLSMRTLIRNPLFLSLVASYVRAQPIESLPRTSFTVFESFVERRLQRDVTWLEKTYQSSADELKIVAEVAAYCMATNEDLGLSAPIEQLIASVSEQMASDDRRTRRHLEALVGVRLARRDVLASANQDHRFTFVHRRFQEYFATCHLLEHPERVAPADLVCDHRWRESTVALIQLRSGPILEPVLREIDQRLSIAVASMHARDDPAEFAWPSGSVHVLDIVASGFTGRASAIPATIARSADEIVDAAMASGDLFNQKWALEISGAVPPESLSRYLQIAFASESRWLRDEATIQAGRLTEMSAEMRRSVAERLVQDLEDNSIYRSRVQAMTELGRLPDGNQLRSALRALIWCRRSAAVILCTMIVFTESMSGRNEKSFGGSSFLVAMSILALLVAIYLGEFGKLVVGSVPREYFYALRRTAFPSKIAQYMVILGLSLLVLIIQADMMHSPFSGGSARLVLMTVFAALAFLWVFWPPGCVISVLSDDSLGPTGWARFAFRGSRIVGGWKALLLIPFYGAMFAVFEYVGGPLVHWLYSLGLETLLHWALFTAVAGVNVIYIFLGARFAIRFVVGVVRERRAYARLLGSIGTVAPGEVLRRSLSELSSPTSVARLVQAMAIQLPSPNRELATATGALVRSGTESGLLTPAVRDVLARVSERAGLSRVDDGEPRQELPALGS